MLKLVAPVINVLLTEGDNKQTQNLSFIAKEAQETRILWRKKTFDFQIVSLSDQIEFLQPPAQN